MLRFNHKLFFIDRVWKGANLERVLFLMEKAFWVIRWNRTNFTEISFAPQNKPNTAKVSFTGVLKHFHQKLTKTFSLRSKNDFLRKNLGITLKLIFSLRVWKKPNPEERFWFDGNYFFWSIQVNETNIKRTVLLLKMSHIQLN